MGETGPFFPGLFYLIQAVDLSKRAYANRGRCKDLEDSKGTSLGCTSSHRCGSPDYPTTLTTAP